MLKITTYIVDSFTDEAFKGNPAGVCLLNSDLSNEKMLLIAKELGLSETAFLKKLDDQSNYSIRYFSPKMEIPLCGHATLASAKILFERDNTLTQIQFYTFQNLCLSVQKKEDLISMEFPIYDTEPSIAPPALLQALGLQSINKASYNRENIILILEIDNCKILQELKPDFEALVRSHDAINGVLVTALSDKDLYDFESRYFWPWAGTNEDPVTGATHTFLTKYWNDKLHKTKLRSFQCSERTGFMELEILSNDKMLIKGNATIIFEGNLRL